MIIVIGCAGLAAAGLAFWLGRGIAEPIRRLTRLAGAVAVIGFVLFAIEVYRSSANDMIEVGAWLVLAGGIVTLIAGFVGPRPMIAPSTNTVVVDE